MKYTEIMVFLHKHHHEPLHLTVYIYDNNISYFKISNENDGKSEIHASTLQRLLDNPHDFYERIA